MDDTKNKEIKLLDSVNYPEDYRHFNISQLKQLSDELREETIKKVMEVGGHLGAGLGVVELTVALHYVFNTPDDLLIWDVSHQIQPHKILTGRKDMMSTLRQKDGISGFSKPSESPYDTFGAGHSSTSISAALGMAVARDMKNKTHDVIAIIGDGALSAGMAYEAMNNAADIKSKMLVILNDNEMSISPAVGAMSGYLSRLMSSQTYHYIRSIAKNVVHHMPDKLETLVKKTKKYIKDCTTGGNFFEELGFHYIGPIDGHDMDQLIPVLQNIKNAEGITSPILLHVKTQKGKGYNSPSTSAENHHAIPKHNPNTSNKPTKPTYTKVFAENLLNIMKKDKDIVGITAAMSTSTGLSLISKEFPERVYDVGIAEQHAVTFAAGLASKNIKPFVAIYSTFLQRAYDQVVHDVAIQSLPVRFIIDRAGFVGSDGETHCGAFDISFLINLPRFVIMAPSDEYELADMVHTSHQISDRPSAIRFPRGEITGDTIPIGKPIEIGKAKIIKQGERAVIISLGNRLQDSLKAAEMIKIQNGISISVVDARFAKPIDSQLIIKLASSHDVIITIEDAAEFGFGSAVASLLMDNRIIEQGKKFKSLTMPDAFISQATPEEQYEESGLDAKGIYNTLIKLLGL